MPLPFPESEEGNRPPKEKVSDPVSDDKANQSEDHSGNGESTDFTDFEKIENEDGLSNDDLVGSALEQEGNEEIIKVNLPKDIPAPELEIVFDGDQKKHDKADSGDGVKEVSQKKDAEDSSGIKRDVDGEKLEAIAKELENAFSGEDGESKSLDEFLESINKVDEKELRTLKPEEIDQLNEVLPEELDQELDKGAVETVLTNPVVRTLIALGVLELARRGGKTILGRAKSGSNKLNGNKTTETSEKRENNLETEEKSPEIDKNQERDTKSPEKDLSKLDMWKLSAEEFQELLKTRQSEIPPNKLNFLKNELVETLTVEQLISFSKEQFQALNLGDLKPDTFEAVTKNRFNDIAPRQMNGLKQDHFAKLPPDKVLALSNEHIQNIRLERLSPELFDTLAKSKLNVMSSQQFFKLPDTHLEKLSHKQLTSLNANHMRCLPLKNLSPEKFGRLAAEKLNQFSANQLSELPPSHVDKLTDGQLKSLSGRNLAAVPLSSERFESFKETIVEKLSESINTKEISEALKPLAEGILKARKPGQPIVILGRHTWPVVPILRAQGVDAQYMVMSRQQLDDPATQKQWRKEVPPGSMVVDTFISDGDTLKGLKKIDPSIDFYTFSEVPKHLKDSGEAKDLPLSEKNRGVGHGLDIFPQLVEGPGETYKDGGILEARFVEEGGELPKRALIALQEKLLKDAGLSAEDAKKYSGFTGITPEERLGLESKDAVDQHNQKVAVLRKANQGNSDGKDISVKLDFTPPPEDKVLKVEVDRAESTDTTPRKSIEEIRRETQAPAYKNLPASSEISESSVNQTNVRVKESLKGVERLADGDLNSRVDAQNKVEQAVKEMAPGFTEVADKLGLDRELLVKGDSSGTRGPVTFKKLLNANGQYDIKTGLIAIDYNADKPFDVAMHEAGHMRRWLSLQAFHEANPQAAKLAVLDSCVNNVGKPGMIAIDKAITPRYEFKNPDAKEAFQIELRRHVAETQGVGDANDYRLTAEQREILQKEFGTTENLKTEISLEAENFKNIVKLLDTSQLNPAAKRFVEKQKQQNSNWERNEGSRRVVRLAIHNTVNAQEQSGGKTNPENLKEEIKAEVRRLTAKEAGKPETGLEVGDKFLSEVIKELGNPLNQEQIKEAAETAKSYTENNNLRKDFAKSRSLRDNPALKQLVRTATTDHIGRDHILRPQEYWGGSQDEQFARKVHVAEIAKRTNQELNRHQAIVTDMLAKELGIEKDIMTVDQLESLKKEYAEKTGTKPPSDAFLVKHIDERFQARSIADIAKDLEIEKNPSEQQLEAIKKAYERKFGVEGEKNFTPSDRFIVETLSGKFDQTHGVKDRGQTPTANNDVYKAHGDRINTLKTQLPELTSYLTMVSVQQRMHKAYMQDNYAEANRYAKDLAHMMGGNVRTYSHSMDYMLNNGLLNEADLKGTAFEGFTTEDGRAKSLAMDKIRRNRGANVGEVIGTADSDVKVNVGKILRVEHEGRSHQVESIVVNKNGDSWVELKSGSGPSEFVDADSLWPGENFEKDTKNLADGNNRTKAKVLAQYLNELADQQQNRQVDNSRFEIVASDRSVAGSSESAKEIKVGDVIQRRDQLLTVVDVKGEHTLVHNSKGNNARLDCKEISQEGLDKYFDKLSFEHDGREVTRYQPKGKRNGPIYMAMKLGDTLQIAEDPSYSVKETLELSLSEKQWSAEMALRSLDLEVTPEVKEVKLTDVAQSEIFSADKARELARQFIDLAKSNQFTMDPADVKLIQTHYENKARSGQKAFEISNALLKFGLDVPMQDLGRKEVFEKVSGFLSGTEGGRDTVLPFYQEWYRERQDLSRNFTENVEPKLRERVKVYENVLNRHLTKNGAHPVSIIPTSRLPYGTGAVFIPGGRQILIPPEATYSLSPKLIGTLAEEALHYEQDNLIVRRLIEQARERHADNPLSSEQLKDAVRSEYRQRFYNRLSRSQYDSLAEIDTPLSKDQAKRADVLIESAERAPTEQVYKSHINGLIENIHAYSNSDYLVEQLSSSRELCLVLFGKQCVIDRENRSIEPPPKVAKILREFETTGRLKDPVSATATIKEHLQIRMDELIDKRERVYTNQFTEREAAEFQSKATLYAEAIMGELGKDGSKSPEFFFRRFHMERTGIESVASNIANNVNFNAVEKMTTADKSRYLTRAAKTTTEKIFSFAGDGQLPESLKNLEVKVESDYGEYKRATLRAKRQGDGFAPVISIPESMLDTAQGRAEALAHIQSKIPQWLAVTQGKDNAELESLLGQTLEAKDKDVFVRKELEKVLKRDNSLKPSSDGKGLERTSGLETNLDRKEKTLVLDRRFKEAMEPVQEAIKQTQKRLNKPAHSEEVLTSEEVKKALLEAEPKIRKPILELAQLSANKEHGTFQVEASKLAPIEKLLADGSIKIDSQKLVTELEKLDPRVKEIIVRHIESEIQNPGTDGGEKKGPEQLAREIVQSLKSGETRVPSFLVDNAPLVGKDGLLALNEKPSDGSNRHIRLGHLVEANGSYSQGTDLVTLDISAESAASVLAHETGHGKQERFKQVILELSKESVHHRLSLQKLIAEDATREIGMGGRRIIGNTVSERPRLYNPNNNSSKADRASQWEGIKELRNHVKSYLSTTPSDHVDVTKAEIISSIVGPDKVSDNLLKVMISDKPTTVELTDALRETAYNRLIQEIQLEAMNFKSVMDLQGSSNESITPAEKAHREELKASLKKQLTREGEKTSARPIAELASVNHLFRHAHRDIVGALSNNDYNVSESEVRQNRKQLVAPALERSMKGGGASDAVPTESIAESRVNARINEVVKRWNEFLDSGIEPSSNEGKKALEKVRESVFGNEKHPGLLMDLPLDSNKSDQVVKWLLERNIVTGEVLTKFRRKLSQSDPLRAKDEMFRVRNPRALAVNQSSSAEYNAALESVDVIAEGKFDTTKLIKSVERVSFGSSSYNLHHLRTPVEVTEGNKGPVTLTAIITDNENRVIGIEGTKHTGSIRTISEGSEGYQKIFGTLERVVANQKGLDRNGANKVALLAHFLNNKDKSKAGIPDVAAKDSTTVSNSSAQSNKSSISKSKVAPLDKKINPLRNETTREDTESEAKSKTTDTTIPEAIKKLDDLVTKKSISVDDKSIYLDAINSKLVDSTILSEIAKSEARSGNMANILFFINQNPEGVNKQGITAILNLSDSAMTKFANSKSGNEASLEFAKITSKLRIDDSKALENLAQNDQKDLASKAKLLQSDPKASEFLSTLSETNKNFVVAQIDSSNWLGLKEVFDQGTITDATLTKISNSKFSRSLINELSLTARSASLNQEKIEAQKTVLAKLDTKTIDLFQELYKGHGTNWKTLAKFTKLSETDQLKLTKVLSNPRGGVELIGISALPSVIDAKTETRDALFSLIEADSKGERHVYDKTLTALADKDPSLIKDYEKALSSGLLNNISIEQLAESSPQEVQKKILEIINSKEAKTLFTRADIDKLMDQYTEKPGAAHQKQGTAKERAKVLGDLFTARKSGKLSSGDLAKFISIDIKDQQKLLDVSTRLSPETVKALLDSHSSFSGKSDFVLGLEGIEKSANIAELEKLAKDPTAFKEHMLKVVLPLAKRQEAVETIRTSSVTELTKSGRLADLVTHLNSSIEKGELANPRVETEKLLSALQKTDFQEWDKTGSDYAVKDDLSKLLDTFEKIREPGSTVNHHHLRQIILSKMTTSELSGMAPDKLLKSIKSLSKPPVHSMNKESVDSLVFVLNESKFEGIKKEAYLHLIHQVKADMFSGMRPELAEKFVDNLVKALNNKSAGEVEVNDALKETARILTPLENATSNENRGKLSRAALELVQKDKATGIQVAIYDAISKSFEDILQEPVKNALRRGFLDGKTIQELMRDTTESKEAFLSNLNKLDKAQFGSLSSLRDSSEPKESKGHRVEPNFKRAFNEVAHSLVDKLSSRHNPMSTADIDKLAFGLELAREANNELGKTATSKGLAEYVFTAMVKNNPQSDAEIKQVVLDALTSVKDPGAHVQDLAKELAKPGESSTLLAKMIAKASQYTTDTRRPISTDISSTEIGEGRLGYEAIARIAEDFQLRHNWEYEHFEAVEKILAQECKLLPPGSERAHKLLSHWQKAIQRYNLDHSSSSAWLNEYKLEYLSALQRHGLLNEKYIELAHPNQKYQKDYFSDIVKHTLSDGRLKSLDGKVQADIIYNISQTKEGGKFASELAGKVTADAIDAMDSRQLEWYNESMKEWHKKNFEEANKEFTNPSDKIDVDAAIKNFEIIARQGNGDLITEKFATELLSGLDKNERAEVIEYLRKRSSYLSHKGLNQVMTRLAADLTHGANTRFAHQPEKYRQGTGMRPVVNGLMFGDSLTGPLNAARFHKMTGFHVNFHRLENGPNGEVIMVSPNGDRGIVDIENQRVTKLKNVDGQWVPTNESKRLDRFVLFDSPKNASSQNVFDFLHKMKNADRMLVPTTLTGSLESSRDSTQRQAGYANAVNCDDIAKAEGIKEARQEIIEKIRKEAGVRIKGSAEEGSAGAFKDAPILVDAITTEEHQRREARLLLNRKNWQVPEYTLSGTDQQVKDTTFKNLENHEKVKLMAEESAVIANLSDNAQLRDAYSLSKQVHESILKQAQSVGAKANDLLYVVHPFEGSGFEFHNLHQKTNPQDVKAEQFKMLADLRKAAKAGQLDGKVLVLIDDAYDHGPEGRKKLKDIAEIVRLSRENGKVGIKKIIVGNWWQAESDKGIEQTHRVDTIKELSIEIAEKALKTHGTTSQNIHFVKFGEQGTVSEIESSKSRQVYEKSNFDSFEMLKKQAEAGQLKDKVIAYVHDFSDSPAERLEKERKLEEIKSIAERKGGKIKALVINDAPADISFEINTTRESLPTKIENYQREVDSGSREAAPGMPGKGKQYLGIKTVGTTVVNMYSRPLWAQSGRSEPLKFNASAETRFHVSCNESYANLVRLKIDMGDAAARAKATEARYVPLIDIIPKYFEGVNNAGAETSYIERAAILRDVLKAQLENQQKAEGEVSKGWEPSQRKAIERDLQKLEEHLNNPDSKSKVKSSEILRDMVISYEEFYAGRDTQRAQAMAKLKADTGFSDDAKFKVKTSARQGSAQNQSIYNFENGVRLRTFHGEVIVNSAEITEGGNNKAYSIKLNIRKVDSTETPLTESEKIAITRELQNELNRSFVGQALKNSKERANGLVAYLERLGDFETPKTDVLSKPVDLQSNKQLEKPISVLAERMPIGGKVSNARILKAIDNVLELNRSGNLDLSRQETFALKKLKLELGGLDTERTARIMEGLRDALGLPGTEIEKVEKKSKTENQSTKQKSIVERREINEPARVPHYNDLPTGFDSRVEKFNNDIVDALKEVSVKYTRQEFQELDEATRKKVSDKIVSEKILPMLRDYAHHTLGVPRELANKMLTAENVSIGVTDGASGIYAAHNDKIIFDIHGQYPANTGFHELVHKIDFLKLKAAFAADPSGARLALVDQVISEIGKPSRIRTNKETTVRHQFSSPEAAKQFKDYVRKHLLKRLNNGNPDYVSSSDVPVNEPIPKELLKEFNFNEGELYREMAKEVRNFSEMVSLIEGSQITDGTKEYVEKQKLDYLRWKEGTRGKAVVWNALHEEFGETKSGEIKLTPEKIQAIKNRVALMTASQKGNTSSGVQVSESFIKSVLKDYDTSYADVRKSRAEEYAREFANSKTAAKEFEQTTRSLSDNPQLKLLLSTASVNKVAAADGAPEYAFSNDEIRARKRDIAKRARAVLRQIKDGTFDSLEPAEKQKAIAEAKRTHGEFVKYLKMAAEQQRLNKALAVDDVAEARKIALSLQSKMTGNIEMHESYIDFMLMNKLIEPSELHRELKDFDTVGGRARAIALDRMRRGTISQIDTISSVDSQKDYKEFVLKKPISVHRGTESESRVESVIVDKNGKASVIYSDTEGIRVKAPIEHFLIDEIAGQEKSEFDKDFDRVVEEKRALLEQAIKETTGDQRTKFEQSLKSFDTVAEKASLIADYFKQLAHQQDSNNPGPRSSQSKQKGDTQARASVLEPVELRTNESTLTQAERDKIKSPFNERAMRNLAKLIELKMKIKDPAQRMEAVQDIVKKAASRYMKSNTATKGLINSAQIVQADLAPGESRLVIKEIGDKEGRPLNVKTIENSEAILRDGRRVSLKNCSVEIQVSSEAKEVDIAKELLIRTTELIGKLDPAQKAETVAVLEEKLAKLGKEFDSKFGTETTKRPTVTERAERMGGFNLAEQTPVRPTMYGITIGNQTMHFPELVSEKRRFLEDRQKELERRQKTSEKNKADAAELAEVKAELEQLNRIKENVTPAGRLSAPEAERLWRIGETSYKAIRVEQAKLAETQAKEGKRAEGKVGRAINVAGNYVLVFSSVAGLLFIGKMASGNDSTNLNVQPLRLGGS